MLLTNKNISAILQLYLRERLIYIYIERVIDENTFREVFTMIYEELTELEMSNELYGVSPLAYVVLDCAR